MDDVTYTGTAQQFSDDGFTIDTDVVQFEVAGQGFLTVDISSIDARINALNAVTLTLQVPAGMKLSDDPAARFTQLATASGAEPLVAIRTGKIKHDVPEATAQLVNQTPNVPATHHVFAVYVSPSNRKVKDPGQANNTAAQNLVDYADTYWSSQSGGNIHFTFDGVVPWYQSTYSCATQAGSASLWSQALTKAKALGYVPGKNNHLALIFPNGDTVNYNYCGGAIGLGTVGGSVNQGGQIWVMGNTDPMARETIAHELGHNMSLGHADWLACPSATPLTGKGSVNAWSGGTRGSVVGCTTHNYGDTTDVMGFGIGDGASGALSSPQAIRAGIWPTGSWQVAPIGTNTYTLSAVGAHTGTRAVVVQDRDGTQYFVEYRNLAVGTDDETNYIGCDSQACTMNVPHVRLLRLEPTDYQGWPGEDSFLIGRSNTNIGWVNNALAQTYTLPGGNIVKINANGVGASSASVTVTRTAPGTVVNDDIVYLTRSLGYDSTLRVGDILTLLVGDWYNVENYTFVWTRDGSTIANTQNYTLQPADVGHRINAYLDAGGGAIYELDEYGDPITVGYLISKGVYQPSDPGPVTVDFPTNQLIASTPVGGAGNWPTGTTFTYQWQRGASASTATSNATGAGATTGSYTPNAADWNQYLRVKVTATVPGYNPVVRYSTAQNYSIQTQSPLPASFKVTGTPKIGTQVSVDVGDVAYYDSGFGDLTGVTLSYQWLRNGVPITDAAAGSDPTDDTDYTLRSLDLNASITLRVTASKNGYVSKSFSTPAFKPTQLGTIQASSPAASVANAFDPAAPMKVALTASYSGVTETELGTAGYQWYRVNRTSGVATAITGATAAVYKPVAADVPYKLRVIVTVKKANYASLPLTYTRDFSVRLDPATPLGFDGVVVKVTNTMAANYPTFKIESAVGVFDDVHWDTANTTETWSWYRAGVKLPGETADFITLGAADLGKQMNYAVTLAYPGYLAYSGTGPKSVPVAATTFTSGGAPLITQSGLVLTVNAALTDINPNATSIGYQWYRNGVAISGATKASYTLTAADYGKTTTVQAIYKKPGYVDKPVLGDPGAALQKYWISASDPAPTFSGQVHVGGQLLADTLDYFNENDPSGTPLTIGSQVTIVYQWLRDGVAIATADAKDDGDYTLVAADKGHKISLRITASDAVAPAMMLPMTITSAATQAVGTNEITDAPTATVTVAPKAGSAEFATTLEATVSAISEPGIAPFKYQWYRDNTAVSGATKSTYALSSADQGKQIWVRVTVTKPAAGPTTWTPVVIDSAKKNYSFTGSATGTYVNQYTSMAVGQYLAPAYVQMQYNGVDVNNPDVRQRYQWFRNGVAIPGATLASYKLVAADLGAKITVRVTSDLAGGGYVPFVATYTTAPPTALVAKGALLGTGVAPTVIHDGALLKAVPPSVTGAVGPGDTEPNANFAYQWLRNGAVITGATKQTYALTSSDSGKDISVRVTASLSGYTSVVLPVSMGTNYNIHVITGAEPYASIGEWAPGNSPSVYGENFVSDEGPVAAPTIKYQWLRAGVAITGAVANTYTLQPADVGKLIQVRLTVSKAGYLPLTFTTVGQLSTPGHHVTDPTVTVVPGPGFGTLAVDLAGVAPASPTPAYSYRWYRSGTAAPIATTAQYKLVAADAGKQISVQVTMTRAGFDVGTKALPQTTPVNYTIVADPMLPNISGPVAVGQVMSATHPPYYEADGVTALGGSPTYLYSWYRDGVLIPGQSADLYTLTASDLGKKITVRVSANLPGRLSALSKLSAPTVKVVSGTIDPGTFHPVITTNATTKVVSVSFAGTPTVPATGGFTYSYKWFREGTATAISTAATYKLVAADSGKAVTVVVTLARSGFTSLALAPVVVNAILEAEPAVAQVNNANASAATTGDVLNVAPPNYYLQEEYPSGSALPTSAQTYQWYCTSDSSPISGATGVTYTVQAADVGCSIYAKVTVTASLHDTFVETTNSIAIS